MMFMSVLVIKGFDLGMPIKVSDTSYIVMTLTPSGKYKVCQVSTIAVTFNLISVNGHHDLDPTNLGQDGKETGS